MVLKVNMSSSQYNLIEWIRLENIVFYFNFIYFGTDGVIDKLMGVVSSIFQYECVAHSQRTQGKTERNLCGSMGWSERVLCKSQSMHAACRALQCHRFTAEREAFVSQQSPPLSSLLLVWRWSPIYLFPSLLQKRENKNELHWRPPS